MMQCSVGARNLVNVLHPLIPFFFFGYNAKLVFFFQLIICNCHCRWTADGKPLAKSGICTCTFSSMRTDPFKARGEKKITRLRHDTKQDLNKIAVKSFSQINPDGLTGTSLLRVPFLPAEMCSASCCRTRTREKATSCPWRRFWPRVRSWRAGVPLRSTRSGRERPNSRP